MHQWLGTQVRSNLSDYAIFPSISQSSIAALTNMSTVQHIVPAPAATDFRTRTYHDYDEYLNV